MKIHLVILLSFSSMVSLYGQSLIEFDYSECLENNVGDSSEVKRNKLVNGVSEIILRTYAPCGGEFIGDFDLLNDRSLNLKFIIKPTIITTKNSEKRELIEIAECNCLYDFTFHFDNLPENDSKFISVNGKSLMEIDQQNIGKEIEVDFNGEK